jgi:hypothetical protein
MIMDIYYLIALLTCGDITVTKPDGEITEIDRQVVERAKVQCNLRYNKCVGTVTITTNKDKSNHYSIICVKGEKNE